MNVAVRPSKPSASASNEVNNQVASREETGNGETISGTGIIFSAFLCWRFLASLFQFLPFFFSDVVLEIPDSRSSLSDKDLDLRELIEKLKLWAGQSQRK